MLYTDSHFNKTTGKFELSFKAGNTVFGNKATGSPFRVYAMTPYQNETLRSWDYSAAAGDTLKDEWQLSDFENDLYHLRIYAPNGFYREFAGDNNNPLLQIKCDYEKSKLNQAKLTGNIVLHITNNDHKMHTLVIA